MMKRIVLMSLLALALPLAAFADNSVDFSNDGGTLSGALSGTSSGLTLTGSVLSEVTGFNGMGKVGSTSPLGLGSVTFSTGSATGSGTLPNGDTYTAFAAGGTFTITSNGTNGLPAGTIFTGTFSKGPILIGAQNVNGTWQYTLTGSVSGTYEGHTVFGMTTQLTTNTGLGGFTGSATLGSGDTNFPAPTVPEPGTLGLLGTGLIGVAGALRRKMKS
jgi:hypothetical protein